MRSIATRLILTSLALLALGWAQVFGMTRGYVCDCGGEVEITAFDHCHGPHGLACHHDDDPVHHHEEQNSDTHEHAPFKEPVQAKQLPLASSAVPMPVLAVLTVLEPLTMLQVVNAQISAPLPPPRIADTGRRWPDVLTRTIALRV